MCEELGYDSVWVGDSWLAKPRFEPITTLAAVASKTERVKLGTSIFRPDLRNPVLLALTWATLDAISGGRTILGVGLGAGPPVEVRKEYEIAGVPVERRGAVLEECIQLVKRLWTEDHVTHSGTHFHLNDVSLGYRPVQKPHPPIWIAAGVYVAPRHLAGSGGSGAEGRTGVYRGPFERVARLGDGWWTALPTPEEYALTWGRIREAASSYGRNPDGIHPGHCTWINVNDDAEKAAQEGKAMLERYHNVSMDASSLERCCFGNPEYCIGWLEQFVSAGARTFGLVFRSFDPVGQMKRFAKEVLPSF